MIYTQYKYAIQLAIIVSSPFVRERREHNEISKKMDGGTDFLKNQQETKKGRYKKSYHSFLQGWNAPFSEGTPPLSEAN